MEGSDIESTFTLDELTVSNLATVDALAKLLIKKGVINLEEFIGELYGGRQRYRALLQGMRSKMN